MDGPISFHGESLPEVRPEDTEKRQIERCGEEKVDDREATVGYVSQGKSHHATCSVDGDTRVRRR
jgi:hypothetical protein